MNRLTSSALALLICGAMYAPARAEVTEPAIVTRAEWKAAAPRVTTMVKQKATYKGIVVHHTQISHQLPRWTIKPIAQKMRDIQADHMKKIQKYRPSLKGKLWGDFAYHFFIDIDGKIAQGRDTGFEGDSGTNYNMSGLLLIVLQGDFTKDRPTEAQLNSLDQLAAWEAKTHGIKGDQITAHNDHAQTECPGPNLKGYVPELKRKTVSALE